MCAKHALIFQWLNIDPFLDSSLKSQKLLIGRNINPHAAYAFLDTLW